MKCTRTAAVLVAMTASMLLTACALRSGPYPGVPELLPADSVDQRGRPVAPPQVVYRIDENRYFELVPRSEGACTDATVFYADKKKGIRSLVVKWDRGAMGGSAFIIDAANDQYLIGPATRGNTDCSSGRVLPRRPLALFDGCRPNLEESRSVVTLRSNERKRIHRLRG